MEILLTVKKISDEAILLTEQNEELTWPTAKLPADIREGDILNFSIMTQVNFLKTKNKQAKDILNEILDTK